MMDGRQVIPGLSVLRDPVFQRNTEEIDSLRRCLVASEENAVRMSEELGTCKAQRDVALEDVAALETEVAALRDRVSLLEAANRKRVAGEPEVLASCRQGKIGYASEQAAIGAANRLRERGRGAQSFAYRCESCDAWHMTRQSPADRKARATAAGRAVGSRFNT